MTRMHAESTTPALDDDDVAAPAAHVTSARRPADRVVGLVAPLLVLAVHLWVGWPRHGVVWTDDEVGPLATARLLAGQGALELAHDSYYPLWAVVLTPVWWVTQDPARAYHLAVLLSAVCAAALVLPLRALARYVGLGPVPAMLVAAAVAVAPSRTVMSSYALIENFVVLVLVLTVVAAVRYSRHPSVARAVLLGVGGAATFLAHGRMVTILGATVLWFAIDLWRGGPAGRRRAAAAGLTTVVLLAVGGFLLHASLAGTLYDSATSRESTAVAAMFGGSPVDLLRTTVGTVWYGAVVWLGLAVVGAAGGVAVVRRELRTRWAGPASWGAVALLGNLAISIMSSARALTEGSLRIDMPTYGRYVEPFFMLLALFGAAVLVRRTQPRRALTVAALAVTAGTSVVVVPWMLTTASPEGWFGPINVPGLLGLMWTVDSGLPWLAASLVAVAATVAFVVTRRSTTGRYVAVAAVGVWLLGSSVVAQVSYQQQFDRELGGPPGLLPVVQAIDAPVSYDADGADWPGQNRFQFWLTPRVVEVFDSSTTPPPTDLVIAREQWRAGERLGFVRVADSLGDEALWVRPGPLEEELRARGVMQPEDVTQPLEGFAATMTRTDAAVDQPVPSDRQSWLHIDVRNDGRQVWTALADLEPPTGAVRAVVWWPVPDGAHPQVVDLPSNVVPGATAPLRVRLDPPPNVVDGALSLTLVQEELGELTPPGQPLLTLPLR